MKINIDYTAKCNKRCCLFFKLRKNFKTSNLVLIQEFVW